MTLRHTVPPAPHRAGRARAFTAQALAVCLLIGSVPGFAQREDAAARREATRARTPVTLNFVNADIEAVSRAIGAMLDRPIIVDPRVKGTVTVYSEQPITVREAYLNYLAALRGMGFTVVENAGLLKVVPEADAKLQAGTVSVGTPALRGDQIITQVFRLSYENANNLVTVLRPLISPNNTINANPGNNTLVITDYADNLQRIARIIAAVDTPASTDVEVVPLKHAVAADLAQLVQRLADGGGGGAPLPPGVPGLPGVGGAVSVVAEPRSNSLILRAPNNARIEQMRTIIEKLDRPTEQAGPAGNIYVVYLRNADATKLATVLRAAFAAGSGGANTGGGGGAGAFQPGPAANVTTLNQAAAGGTSQSAATAPVGASASPSTGGFVQADPATNSLIITAPEPLYRQVRAVIDQLDSRRAQIYIEALIVEVNATEDAALGLQWLLLAGTRDGERIAGGAGTALPVTNVQNIFDFATALASGNVPAAGTGLVAAGLNRFGTNGRYGLGVLAQAFAGNNGANILSAPNLVTLDNEEAKIVVGRNVPFITGTFTNTGTGTGATNPFQTIERKDVGLVLRVRPQVGEGNTVRMTIFQESSDVLPGSVPGTANAGPATSKRTIESTVVVDDGNVIVLGGLISDTVNGENSKVPLLGDIPVVGGLFRSERRERAKSNLMVFLRPVVMRDQEASNSLSLDRYDMIRTLQTQQQTPATRHILPSSGAPVLPDPAVVQPRQPLIGVRPAPVVVEPAPPAPAPSAPPPAQ